MERRLPIRGQLVFRLGQCVFEILAEFGKLLLDMFIQKHAENWFLNALIPTGSFSNVLKFGLSLACVQPTASPL